MIEFINLVIRMQQVTCWIYNYLSVEEHDGHQYWPIIILGGYSCKVVWPRLCVSFIMTQYISKTEPQRTLKTHDIQQNQT